MRLQEQNCDIAIEQVTVGDFIDHLDHWIEYLTVLLDTLRDIGSIRKYERQIKFLLQFRMGQNANVMHNRLLQYYYSKKTTGNDDLRFEFEVEREKEERKHPLRESDRLAKKEVDNFFKEASEYVTTGDMALTDVHPISPNYKVTDTAFKVVQKALAAKDLFFIQGPPGTGKTTAIVEIILQTIKAKPRARILVCSETHVAVDNALDRLVAEAPQHIRDEILRYKEYEITEFESEYTEITSANKRVEQLWMKAEQLAPLLTENLYDSLPKGNPKDANDDKSVTIPSWQYLQLAEMHQIIGVTCNQIEHLIDENSDHFDLAIVDECSKATMPEWLMAMCVSRKCILVGDQKQLPPTFCEEEGSALKSLEKYKEDLIRNGVLERLYSNMPETMRDALVKQYRMLPHIGCFISENFYDGKLKHDREQVDHSFDQFGWFDYNSRDVVVPQHSDAPLVNPIEIQMILGCLKSLYEQRIQAKKQSDYRKISVAVITPYRAQCCQLDCEIKKLKLNDLLAIEVATVDAFQGRQADLVFFSFVRTTGSAKFYADPRRINVAISRARDGVYLFGSRHYLKSRKLKVLDSLLELKDVPLFGEVLSSQVTLS
ncbi:DEAD/DEAH box helicase [Comamonas jiangduensis]|uniref:DEAD/DEAH box helicase n=1 Tax=Comamonas jiangduensis TaxID=1194168 RepID=UPI003BF89531